MTGPLGVVGRAFARLAAPRARPSRDTGPAAALLARQWRETAAGLGDVRLPGLGPPSGWR
ncbi:hypothetical protein ACIG3E_40825 [Streptomyces sp. NPDC053474]|uniref:hypothetical protein n=1 Tax=Streptomyces sp. NPDC053474 TaxID=3365704 RepID=UPI0037CEC130